MITRPSTHIGHEETRASFPTPEIVAGSVQVVLIRVGIAVALFAVVAVIALVLERRRRTNAPLQGQPVVPAQLDRADFPRPEVPWLVVVFTSASCESCAGLYEKVAPLESPDV